MNSRLAGRFCGFAAVIMLAFSASAKTNYVDNALKDYTGHDGTSWEKAYKRIQSAVEAASNGDTVLVAPGEYGDDQGVVVDNGSADGSNVNYSYRENRIWINNKHITLKSRDGAAVTHIVGRHSTDTELGVGSNCVRCISLSGNANIGGTRIEGFTIRDGATLEYNTGKSYKTDGTIVSACPASHRGGGLLFNYVSGTSNGSPTFSLIHVVDCVISNCVAAEGAATFGVSLIRTRVTDCRTGRSYGTATVQGHAANCIFDGNGTTDYEGCMRCIEGGKPICAINCTFFNNKGVMNCGSGKAGALLNCFIQRNGRTENGYPIVNQYGGVTNCVTDADVTASDGNNVYLADRKNNALLVAPIYGDFRPVRNPATPHMFGAGDKSLCSMAWIPEADRGRDFDGKARWNDKDQVTVGAYQEGYDVKGGCLTFTWNRYAIDGREFKGPSNGYFYTDRWPAQFRVKLTPSSGKEFVRVWMGGYLNNYRYLDDNDEMIVTAPPKSSDGMLCLAPEETGVNVVWADANYAGGDSDGSEAKPFTTLQDAAEKTTTSGVWIVKVRPGRYDRGGSNCWGNARLHIGRKNVTFRALEGPEKTFIVGGNAPNGNADGCGQGACRCVSVDAMDTQVAFLGFTLTGGRTCANEQTCDQTWRMGGGFLANSQANAQLIGCVISNCVSVRGSATYKGWLQGCRILGCKQANTVDSALAKRGVTHYSHMSGCVVGPNAFATVGIDQFCKLFNCTVCDTSATLHLSADSDYCNVLDVGANWQSKITGSYMFIGCAIQSTNPGGIAPQRDFLALTDTPLAAQTQEDFRPLVGSPVLGVGASTNTSDFVLYSVGGFYGDCFPAEAFPIGATSDAATPVEISSLKGIAIGGLGTPFTSAQRPLTLTATRTDRGFDGYRVNGEIVTEDRTLTLSPSDGVAKYTVEPLYQKTGLVLIFR